ncbi:hypothetical protein CLOM_g14890 [Closterium sp. NIES-68]|nr:hypothetical protein CLOM_g14890 [Closterium sp. NIES-68]
MVLIHPSIISSVATRLGRKWEDEEGRTMYEKGEDCIGSLRDLQRLMRRDHPVSRDVLVQLGRWDIVRSDLVPIICRYRHDSSLLLNAVKLLVFLTMPSPPPAPDLDAAGRQQQQKLTLEHRDCQRRFKSALLHGAVAVTSGAVSGGGGSDCMGSGENDAIAIVLQLLVAPLGSIQSGRGTGDDWRLVQMIVTLVRNLLAIPDPPPDVSSASAWAHLCFLQDDFIRALFRSGFPDVLLFLISCLDTPETAPSLRHDNLLFLEVVNLLFQGLPPKDAAIAAFRSAGQADAEADAREDREAAERLAEARRREKEREARKALAQKITQRHSRFGGLYVVRNADKSRTVSSAPFSPPVHHAIFSQVRRGPVRRVMGGSGTGMGMGMGMGVGTGMGSGVGKGMGMGLDGGLNGDGGGGNGGNSRRSDADVDAELGLVGGARANRRSGRWTARRLGVFAERLLASGCYNVLMETVRRDVANWRPGLEPSDTLAFFLVAAFFTAFQREMHGLRGWGGAAARGEEAAAVGGREAAGGAGGAAGPGGVGLEGAAETGGAGGAGGAEEGSKKVEQRAAFGCGPIAATMDDDMLALVSARWAEYAARPNHERAALVAAGSLLKEMIHMLDAVIKSGEKASPTAGGSEEVRQEVRLEVRREVRLARAMLLRLFYDDSSDGVLHVLQRLLKGFNPHTQPRCLLVDAVEATHVCLRLLEYLVETEGALKVVRKSRLRKERARKGKDKGEGAAKGADAEKEGDQAGHQEKMQERKGVETEEGKKEPEGQDEGAAGAAGGGGGGGAAAAAAAAAAEEEDDEEAAGEGLEDSDPGSDLASDAGSDIGSDAEPGEGIEEAEEEGRRGKEEVREYELDVKRALMGFADVHAVKNCVWLLETASSNSPRVNHYVLSLLRRFTVGCSAEPMLFQVSTLHTFYKLLTNPDLQASPLHAPLLAFLSSSVRHLSALLPLRPSLVLRLLLDKPRKECMAIAADVALGELRAGGKGRGKSQAFSQEQEARIRQLFASHKSRRNAASLIARALIAEGHAFTGKGEAGEPEAPEEAGEAHEGCDGENEIAPQRDPSAADADSIKADSIKVLAAKVSRFLRSQGLKGSKEDAGRRGDGGDSGGGGDGDGCADKGGEKQVKKGMAKKTHVIGGKKGRRRQLVFDSDSEEGSGDGEVSEGGSEGGSEGESEVEEEIGLAEMEGGERREGVGEEEGGKEGGKEGEGLEGVGEAKGHRGEESAGGAGLKARGAGNARGSKTGLAKETGPAKGRRGNDSFTDEDDSLIKTLYSEASRLKGVHGRGRSKGMRGAAAIAREISKAMEGKFSAARISQRIQFLGLPEEGAGRKTRSARRRRGSGGLDDILRDMDGSEGGEEGGEGGEEGEKGEEEREEEEEEGEEEGEEREEGEEVLGEVEIEKEVESEDEENVLLSKRQRALAAAAKARRGCRTDRQRGGGVTRGGEARREREIGGLEGPERVTRGGVAAGFEGDGDGGGMEAERDDFAIIAVDSSGRWTDSATIMDGTGIGAGATGAAMGRSYTERGLIESGAARRDSGGEDGVEIREEAVREGVQAVLADDAFDGAEAIRWLQSRLKAAHASWTDAIARNSWQLLLMDRPDSLGRKGKKTKKGGRKEGKEGKRKRGEEEEEGEEEGDGGWGEVVHVDFSLVEELEDWDTVANDSMALLLSALSLKHPDEADGCWRIPGDRGTQWLLHAVGMLAKMVAGGEEVCNDAVGMLEMAVGDAREGGEMGGGGGGAGEEERGDEGRHEEGRQGKKAKIGETKVCELTVCDDSTAVDGGEGVMRGCLGPKHKRRKETGAVQAGQNGHGWMSEKEGSVCGGSVETEVGMEAGEEGRARVDWEGKREHGSRKNNGQGEGFEQDGVSWRHEGSVEHASFPLPLPLMPGVLGARSKRSALVADGGSERTKRVRFGDSATEESQGGTSEG